MENISNKIAKKIAINQKLDKEKEAVIAYGTFALLQTIISLLLVYLLGGIFGVGNEAVIISCFVSILRKYTGGVHATSPGRCILLGVVICITQAIFIKYCIVKYLSVYSILITCTIIMVFSYYFVKQYAPVESKRKPINNEKKRMMNKKAINILYLYSLLGVICLLCNIYISSNFNNYFVCIFFATIWQVFTMSKLGHVFILNIDALLIYTKKEGLK